VPQVFSLDRDTLSELIHFLPTSVDALAFYPAGVVAVQKVDLELIVPAH
jgi:hypothetical protein